MRVLRCLLITLSGFVLLFSLSGCSKHTIKTQGYIEGQFIYLAANTSGHLQSLLIYRGNFVKANQTLFILDPEPEQSDLQQAQAKLQQEQENLANVIRGQRSTVLAGILAQQEKAQADFLYAKQKMLRYQKLYQINAISKDQLDQAVADEHAQQQLVNQYTANLAEAKLGSREHVIAAQQAAVNSALASVKKNEWQLQQKTVSAPKAGQIFDTFFKVGEYVPAGQAVTALLTPDNIKLIFFVPEPELHQLALNSLVHFNCDGCPKNTPARVTYIAPQAEYTPPVIYSETSRAKLVYRVECAIAEKEAVLFHAGQPVTVTIDTR